MANATVVCINPNFMRPPIAPLAFDYLAPALERRGYEPVSCDLAFAADWRRTLSDTLADAGPAACLVTARNLDDAYFASRDFILEDTAAVVRHARACTGVPVVLGGVGFAIAPREALAYLGADCGLHGDADGVGDLLDALLAGDVSRAPGAVYRADGDGVRANPPAFAPPVDTAPSQRDFVDNRRYFAEGGQAGIETKRGCAQHCIYCVEPGAKGRAERLRGAGAVIAEMRALLDQGIGVFHFCDSEFNLPAAHARALCEAMVREGLPEHIRWYAYVHPADFDEEIAQCMARAGCAGLNFGIDHMDPGMLRRLGRTHTPDDVARAVRACAAAGIPVMLDLLLGGPGETRDSLAECIGRVGELPADCVGLSCGARVYPHTPLAALVTRQGRLGENPNLHGATVDNADLLRPVFYVDAGIGCDIFDAVDVLVCGDPRFLHANPNTQDGNYNYNDNQVLEAAIRDGARGAYWDILRRIRAGEWNTGARGKP